MGCCAWADANPLYKAYHDREWGVPVHDDRTMFEHLMLECMQCGLSWSLMLRKREIFRSCFDGFDYERIASYGEADIERILSAEGMIRSRRKIEAVIGNARAFLKVREEFGTFCDYLWAFTRGMTIIYHGHDGARPRIPVSNGLSLRISWDLKKRSFKYVGPVTIYSHLQACGMVNDHSRDCPCFERICSHNPTVVKRRDHEVY